MAVDVGPCVRPPDTSRGVIDQSAVEYMLYHQNSFAQVKPAGGRSPRASPCTTWFDYQNDARPLAVVPAVRDGTMTGGWQVGEVRACAVR